MRGWTASPAPDLCFDGEAGKREAELLPSRICYRKQSGWQHAGVEQLMKAQGSRGLSWKATDPLLGVYTNHS